MAQGVNIHQTHPVDRQSHLSCWRWRSSRSGRRSDGAKAGA